MTFTTTAQQGPYPDEDYGLGAVAQHNAAVISTEQFPAYQEDANGLGICHDGNAYRYQESPAYVHNPPTPRSNPASDGMRTRSGRSTRGRTDSPFGTDKSRVSKSPASGNKKDKKAKLDRSKTPKLTAPLSVLTKDMSVPLKDMDAWVHRPAEERQGEVEKRNGYVVRPMNAFMLYRSAYAERTKQWCLQNNHQVVSSVSGESWPMEPQEVRDQFNEWARIERANHQAAHPDYKFSPSKSTNKRRKGDLSDDEDDGTDLEGADPDGEYRGPARSVRQRRRQQEQQQQAQQQQQQVPLNNTYGFDSHPYYGVTGYEQSQYQYANPGRPLPSNVAYDANGLAYDPRTGQYIQTSTYKHSQYPYVQDGRGVRVQTPASLNGKAQQTIGGYGLPGGQYVSAEDLFTASRMGTPIQHYGQSYGLPAYPQYTHQQAYIATQAYQHQQQQAAQQMYEHAQYLQAASNPQLQVAIDPSLDAMLAEAAAGHPMPAEDHFGNAMGDMTAGNMAGLPEYYEESTSPNGALAPAWSPTEALR